MYRTCVMKTTLSLEELAEIISRQLLGGIPFGGKERSIWEEVPAVYINAPIFGMLIVLGEGRKDDGDKNCFVLETGPWGDFSRYIYDNNVPYEIAPQDDYLYQLLKFGLRDVPEVEILEHH